jgi:LDH2 family malate/lactate/ureidoglycolate dehydrogenase
MLRRATLSFLSRSVRVRICRQRQRISLATATGTHKALDAYDVNEQHKPTRHSIRFNGTTRTIESEVGMVHVTIDEATEMTTKALRRIGWDEYDATVQAEIMVAAELCGNNQGLVKMYQPLLMAPSTNVQKPIVTRETAISAVVDARQSPGMIAAITASDLVVQKVQSSNLPIAIVCSHNSSTSSGQLAHYVERIARNHNMIGIAMCNSPEFVAAGPKATPTFGTNPLAISIPLADSPYPYTVR